MRRMVWWGLVGAGLLSLTTSLAKNENFRTLLDGAEIDLGKFKFKLKGEDNFTNRELQNDEIQLTPRNPENEMMGIPENPEGDYIENINYEEKIQEIEASLNQLKSQIH